MIVNNDLRGIQAWATKTIIPDNRDAKGIRGNRLKPARIIREMKKTPFKGLTTDMRGRDLLGYAVLKNFKTTTKKNDIMSSRLVNPNPKFALYPQPKIDKFKSSLDIKPSELDMLNKLKSDNGKMLIIQILKSRSIGVENLKGDPNQRARLLKAFNDLTAKYEIEYTKNNPASAYLLQEYEAQFKREVQDIYGIPYDDLNKPANTSAELQAILKAIQDNTTQLNNIFNMPPTIGDIASGGATPVLIQPDSDDEDIGPLTPNPAYDEKNKNIRVGLLTTIVGNLQIIKDGLTRDGIQYTDDMFIDFIVPRIIEVYNRNGLKPEIKTTDTREFEKLIRQGDINILQNLVPITEYLSRLPTPTQQDIGNIPRVESSDDEVVDLVPDAEEEPGISKEESSDEDVNELHDDVIADSNKLISAVGEKEAIVLLKKKMKQDMPDDVEDGADLHGFIGSLGKGELKTMQRHLKQLIKLNPRANDIPGYSDDAKQATIYRSAGELEDDGKVRVECYPCKKKILWTSYAKHIETKLHKDNLKSFSSSSVGNGKRRVKHSIVKKPVIRGRGITVSELRKQLKAIINV